MHPEVELAALRRHTTPGGARVVVLPRAGAPLAVYLRMAWGSGLESDAQSGLAHFLEHMVFKGTATRGVGETAAAIESLGGDLNAWTSHDEIVLHATITEGTVDDALGLLVDMLTGAALDPEELVREREVVLEEIAQAHADPDDRLADAVGRAMWPGHPYGRTVLGQAGTLRALTRDDLAGWLARARTAQPTLVVVGDVDPEAVDEAVRRYLPKVDGPVPALPEAPTPPDTLQIARVAERFDDRLIEVAWRGPDATHHPDRASLAVLVGLLGETAGDRLSEALDRDPKAGFDAWAAHSEPLVGSTVSLGFRPLPGRTADALSRVRRLVDGLRRGVRGRLVQRAREALLATLDSAWQTVDGVADLLLHHEVRDGDARAVVAWRRALAAVTPEDVVRAAARWLDPDTAVLGVLDPDTPDADLRAAWAPPAPFVAVSSRRDVVHTEVHGVPVVIAPAHGPVAALRLRAPGGWLRVAGRHAGLGPAWSRTVARGAGPYDAEAFFDALDERAAVLSAMDGPGALAFAGTSPTPHLLDLLDLVQDVVLDPHFAEEELDIVREELLDDVRTRNERPREVLDDLLAAHRYPAHPWRLPAGGTVASLQGLKSRAVSRLHRDHWSRGGFGLAVVADVDPQQVVDGLDWLSELPAPHPARPAVTPPWRPLADAEVVAGRTTATVQVWADVPGLDADPHTRAAWRLAESVLDGQAGRLFLEIREARGLVYDVHPSSVRHADHGLLLLLATCRPERLDETRQALLGTLEGLVDRPATDDELSRARAYLRGRSRRGAQPVTTRAARLARTLTTGVDDGIEALGPALDDVGAAEIAKVVSDALARGLIVGSSRPRED